MRKVAILGAIFLGLTAPAGAAEVAPGSALLATHTTNHHRAYWWMAVADCTISTAVKGDTYRGIPYITCIGAPSHWGSTPQAINPADNAAAPYGPCGYEGRLC